MLLTQTYHGTALLVRTDFSDDQAWAEVGDAAQAESPEGFRACLELVDDRRFEGYTAKQAVAGSPPDEEPFFVFLVDRVTTMNPDHPILVVDLRWEPGRQFRLVPAAMWSVENNLSLSNMDWEDFASSVDADGVFRGF